MSNSPKNRRPKGSPAGGQFAAQPNAPAAREVQLTDGDTEAERRSARSRRRSRPELPEYRDGFLRADLAEAGDILSLPDTPGGQSTITDVEHGIDINFNRVVVVYTEAGGPTPQTYLANAYVPVTKAPPAP